MRFILHQITFTLEPQALGGDAAEEVTGFVGCSAQANTNANGCNDNLLS